MAKRTPLIDDGGEVRELTSADFKRLMPFSALPKSEQKRLLSLRGATIEHVSDCEYEAHKKRRRGERGVQVAPTKKLVTIRLSAHVVEHFKADGPGWQTRIDETLQRWVKRPASRIARREGVIR